MVKKVLPTAKRIEMGENVEPTVISGSDATKSADSVSVNCCSAEGWPELYREHLDKTKRPTLNLCADRKTNRIPAYTWKGYDVQQHWTDILRRDYIRHTTV